MAVFFADWMSGQYGCDWHSLEIGPVRVNEGDGGKDIRKPGRSSLSQNLS
jgi:hypothetical protein